MVWFSRPLLRVYFSISIFKGLQGVKKKMKKIPLHSSFKRKKGEIVRLGELHRSFTSKKLVNNLLKGKIGSQKVI